MKQTLINYTKALNQAKTLALEKMKFIDAMEQLTPAYKREAKAHIRAQLSEICADMRLKLDAAFAAYTESVSSRTPSLDIFSPEYQQTLAVLNASPTLTGTVQEQIFHKFENNVPALRALTPALEKLHADNALLLIEERCKEHDARVNTVRQLEDKLFFSATDETSFINTDEMKCTLDSYEETLGSAAGVNTSFDSENALAIAQNASNAFYGETRTTKDIFNLGIELPSA